MSSLFLSLSPTSSPPPSPPYSPPPANTPPLPLPLPLPPVGPSTLPVLKVSGTVPRNQELSLIAKLRRQGQVYYEELVKLGGANPTAWSTEDGDGRTGKAKGGRPNIKTFATYRSHHFDVRNTANWTTSLTGDAETSPVKVRASDHVVLWASLHMNQTTRAATYPADFDTHGDIRATRVPMDPPAIVKAHGLYWFPVWKGAYILCGSWWTAMGWMLERTVERSTSANQVKRTWIAGLVLAPQDAVDAAGWTLHLETHLLRWSTPIGNPQTLTQAAKMHKIDLEFRLHPDAQCWAIITKTTVTLLRQIQIPGFNNLVHPTASPMDPNSAVLIQVYTDRGLPYGPAPPSDALSVPIDWSTIALPSRWKPKRRIRISGNTVRLIGDSQEDNFLDEDAPVVVPLLVPPPTGHYDADNASLKGVREYVTNAMQAVADPNALAFFSAALNAMALNVSVKTNPLTMELATGLGRQFDRQMIRDRIESHSDLDLLLAEATDVDVST